VAAPDERMRVQWPTLPLYASLFTIMVTKNEEKNRKTDMLKILFYFDNGLLAE